MLKNRALFISNRVSNRLSAVRSKITHMAIFMLFAVYLLKEDKLPQDFEIRTQEHNDGDNELVMNGI